MKRQFLFSLKNNEKIVVIGVLGVYMVFSVFQVGDSIVNSDCTQEFTCVREGGAARLDARPLPGCNEHEECQPRQGVRKCVCAPGFKKIDGVCQGESEFNITATCQK